MLRSDMTLPVLFTILAIAPTVVVAIVWLLRPDDKRLGDAVFTAAGMWYVSLFGITGVIYIFNTLTTISSYGG
jgi:uncharacterized membrane protein YdcZ (DUF606 family)